MKVTLAEFGDYQCPHCAKAYYVVKRLQKNLSDKFSHEFKNFPLVGMHPQALMSAEAAEAARSQGKFEEMHDALFEHQRNLGEYFIFSMAKTLGLDMQQFTEDFTSHKFMPVIQKHVKEAMELGVQGTPAFFINGEAFEEDFTYENLKAAIEAAAGGSFREEHTQHTIL